jgi:UDP-glucose-4-epimerase GalE
LKKVFVTGGAGYIGSHVCKALAAAGFSPVTFDNLETGHRWAVQWGPFEKGDLADLPRLNQALAWHRPVAVLHFAGCAYVGESVLDPMKYYRNNVGGTLNLLTAMIQSGVRHIIFSSSCTTYGTPSATPLSEDHPQHPNSPYGSSKYMIERILADCREGHGLHSVSLRYFNAAGADPDGECGEDHDPETHIIPRALMAAAGELGHIDIYGTSHPTSDGTCVRDYVHVSDLAAGHISALYQLLEGRALPPMNIGVGRGYSVREVISVVQKVTGRKVAVREAPSRLGDNPVLVANGSLARRMLGFNPRFTTLEDMVGTAWDWFRKHRSAAALKNGFALGRHHIRSV